MKRPFSSIRPIGPFAQRQAQDTGVEVRNGPIWTWLEVTTFQGNREESPKVTREHEQFVDSEVKRIMALEEVSERLEFAGEINEFDIFCESSSDLTISCFIRHAEDFISITPLDEVIDVFQANINAHKDLTVRDYRVVSEEFVEQRQPEIV